MIGGGARGRALAQTLVGAGHAVRITTRTEAGREAIEAVGAQCWIGTPDRVATLRYALENVTVACWLLGTATGPAAQVRDIHGSRLDFFTRQTIDTSVRGIVYEAAGTVAPRTLAAAAVLVRELADYNAIPVQIIDVDPSDHAAW